MRLGGFELAVVRKGSLQHLDEVVHQGKVYVVAAPGEEFMVELTAHSIPVNATYKAELFVDGKPSGLLQRLHYNSVGVPRYYEGWFVDGDTASCSYLSFKFATPQVDARKAVTGSDFSEGKLLCEPDGRRVHLNGLCKAANDAQVWEAQRSTRQYRASGPNAISGGAKVAGLPEGKKFFLAPSLTTGTGAATQGSGLSTIRYDKIGHEPIARLELRYETAATLVLRGVLKPERNREHRRIVDAAMAAEARMQGGDGEEEEEEKASKATSNKRKVKQEARPQRQQRQQEQQQEDEPEKIDLTGRVPWVRRENDPLLVAKREGKELVCDMTGEADQPRWQEKKKRAIRVDV